jgi:hypothetical protein
VGLGWTDDAGVDDLCGLGEAFRVLQEDIDSVPLPPVPPAVHQAPAGAFTPADAEAFPAFPRRRRGGQTAQAGGAPAVPSGMATAKTSAAAPQAG